MAARRRYTGLSGWLWTACRSVHFVASGESVRSDSTMVKQDFVVARRIAWAGKALSAWP